MEEDDCEFLFEHLKDQIEWLETIPYDHIDLIRLQYEIKQFPGGKIEFLKKLLKAYEEEEQYLRCAKIRDIIAYQNEIKINN